MSETINLVLKMMIEGMSLNEIQNELSLSNRELSFILKQIKNSGFNYTKSYFSDGQVFTKVNHSLAFNPENNVFRINVRDRIFRAVFISDLHIGSIYERPDLLKIVFDYLQKHDIHNLFNGGDVIENVYEDRLDILKTKTALAQARKVLRIYPAVKDIVSYNLYGNHDYKSIIDQGFDIARYLEERRYDLVSLGYGTSIIKLKDDAIGITHDLSRARKRKNISDDVTIVFKGHSHKAKNRENKLIYIPSLSEDPSVSYEYRPLMGFLDVEFIFFEKLISKINIKHLALVNNEIRLANEESITTRPEIEQRRTESRMTKKFKPNPGPNSIDNKK